MIGQKIEELETLGELKEFAARVDDAIHRAVSEAIQKYLPIRSGMLPFDILLIGGDEVLMVVWASDAMDVAYTIAQRFHELTRQEHTLSVGVVLAPVKYPFGLLLDLAEDALKMSKEKSTDSQGTGKSSGNTRINFVTVMDTANNMFSTVYESLHTKRDVQGREVEFYATLRPYSLEQLAFLLSAIREGHKRRLGRTKLHKLREMILKLNVANAVGGVLPLLKSWNDKQRGFVVSHVYKMGDYYQIPRRNPSDPTTWAFHNPFPWFADGRDIYRTSLLDFVDLCDFVRWEGNTDSD
jgi:hypothetical protein